LIGGGGSKFKNFFAYRRRRRLGILSWSAAAAGKFKNEKSFRK
jgi:hypothetical protein